MQVVNRDTQIQQRVIQELRWDTRIEATDVGVEVRDGTVTLSGTVESYAEKLAAQEAAHRVTGVLDVANEVIVKVPASHVRSDADIARAVRHALEWNVQIPSDHIRSTVADGWIALEGHVFSWRQRLDAESAIRYLSGVRGVTNKINVSPPNVDAADIRQAIETALERRAEREARRIQIDVADGKVTLTGWVRTWLEKQSILGAVGHAPGVQEVVDSLQIDPYV